MDGPLFTSYADVVRYVARARGQRGERRVAHWATVVENPKGYYTLMHTDTNAPLCVFTRDNTLTMVATAEVMEVLKFTLAQVLGKVVPVWTYRRNGETMMCSRGSEAVKYFPGMQYDFETSRLLNPAPRVMVNVSARKEWLRTLRQFRKGLQVRAKLGVLDRLCTEVADERVKTVVMRMSTWSRPDWREDPHRTLLITSMRDNVYPTELLVEFVRSIPDVFWRSGPLTPQEAVNQFEGIVSTHSIMLRREFGVLVDETQPSIEGLE
jgi:hypothetical protein